MNAIARVVVCTLAATAWLGTVRPTQAQTFEEQVLELVNVERWTNGELPPLKGQTNLREAAYGHSQAMGVGNFFAHCNPDTGLGPGARITAAGYSWNGWAENIAAGYSTAADVMTGWMNSPGHRGNILSTTSRELGVGYYFDPADTDNVREVDGCTPTGQTGGPYRHYWTQNFGLRSDVHPVVIAREAWQVSQCLIDVYLYGAGWATQYRLSNDGSNWSAWQPFASDVLWNLSGAAGGMATVHAQIRNGAGTVRAAQDSVRLAVACSVSDVIFANGFQ